MKALKVLLTFVIIYFAITAFSAMNRLIEWISRGNELVTYGLYIVLALLTVIYIVVPIIDYFNRPSLDEVEGLMEGDQRSGRRVRRHLLNIVEGEDFDKLKEIDKKDIEGIQAFVKEFLIKETDAFDKIIRTYAFKLTSTVLSRCLLTRRPER